MRGGRQALAGERLCGGTGLGEREGGRRRSGRSGVSEAVAEVAEGAETGAGPVGVEGWTPSESNARLPKIMSVTSSLIMLFWGHHLLELILHSVR